MCAQVSIDSSAINQSAATSVPVVRKRSVRHVRKAASAAVTAVALLVLALAAVGAKTIISSIGGDAEIVCTGTSDTAGLQANVGSITRSSGYITVAGSVANHLNRQLPSVNAVLELMDRSGHIVGVEQAVVTYGALRAGESSPFSIMTSDAKGASQCRVSFRQADGSPIE